MVTQYGYFFYTITVVNLFYPINYLQGHIFRAVYLTTTVRVRIGIVNNKYTKSVKIRKF